MVEEKPTRGEVQSILHYDETTGLLHWKTSRANNKVKAGSIACIKAAKGYMCVFLRGRKYKAHHVVWLLCKGFWPTRLDHIDGVRDNNRVENLREADEVENSSNRGLNKNNKLGIKGVHILPSGRYRASISYLGIKYNLGVFNTIEEAGEAYQTKSIELRKEFHRDDSKAN